MLRPTLALLLPAALVLGCLSQDDRNRRGPPAAEGEGEGEEGEGEGEEGEGEGEEGEGEGEGGTEGEGEGEGEGGEGEGEGEGEPEPELSDLLRLSVSLDVPGADPLPGVHVALSHFVPWGGGEGQGGDGPTGVGPALLTLEAGELAAGSPIDLEARLPVPPEEAFVDPPPDDPGALPPPVELAIYTPFVFQDLDEDGDLSDVDAGLHWASGSWLVYVRGEDGIGLLPGPLDMLTLGWNQLEVQLGDDVLPTPRPWERVIELPVSLLPRLVLQVIGTLRTEGGAAWPADLQHAKVIALVVGDRDETPAAGRTVASLPVVLEGSREVAFSMELPDLLRPPHDRVFEGVGDPYLALAFALIDDLDDDGRLDMHGDRCLLVGWDVWDFYVRGPVPMLLPHGFPTGHSLVEPPEEGGGGEEGEEEEGGFSLERLPDDTPVTLTWTGLPRCGPPEEPPPEVRSCKDLSDDDVMKAVYEGPKVPEGFYSDPPDLEGSLRWQDPCSDSLDATRAAAGQTFANGQLTGDERTTDWFHEVDVRINAGANLVHFRQDRCDWWDGQRLGGGPHLDFGGLGFLAGYRWYVHNHNIGGHAILRGFGQIGNASHFYDLCYVRTVFGDWGLADAITVLWTRYRIGIEDGDVEVLREAEVVRELEGRRN